MDFGALNECKELLLIEIEKPGLQLSNEDGGVTAEYNTRLIESDAGSVNLTITPRPRSKCSG